ncbi:MAG: hypothetical protein NT013_11575 [Planctomycetia bacterium]|nr:hypothetical protein [Planctomycetia bacterium]
MSSAALFTPSSAQTSAATVLPAERSLEQVVTRRRTTLWRVSFVVLAFFLGAEVLTRTVLFRISKDISKFQTFTQRAEALAAQPGTSIAFVGNSLTERGIDSQLFAETLIDAGAGPVSADVFSADASKINVWHYLLTRYFWKPGHNPDVFVVSFYENNLADKNPLEIGRFAQFFVDRDDWSEVFKHDLTSSSERFEFLLSSVWATYAARERTKERGLSLLIPHYQELTVQANDVLRQQAAKSKIGTDKAVSHELLKRFIARAREHHSKILFVAFPTIIPERERPYQPYELDPEMLSVIRDGGMEFADLRQVPELTPEMYADDIHLNEKGRPVYSRYLAIALRSFIEKLSIDK